MTLEQLDAKLDDRARKTAETLLEQLEGDSDAAVDHASLERLHDWYKAQAAFE